MGIARLPKGRVGSAANLFSLNTKPDWTVDGTSELGCKQMQNVLIIITDATTYETALFSLTSVGRGLRSRKGFPVSVSKVLPWMSARPNSTSKALSCSWPNTLYAAMNLSHFMLNDCDAMLKKRVMPSALNSPQLSRKGALVQNLSLLF